MAFQMDILLLNELKIKDAYIKIGSIVGNKDKIDAYFMSFINKQSSVNQLEPIAVKLISFTPSLDDSSGNFIQQGYEYAKTLPEFLDSIDVLEEG